MHVVGHMVDELTSASTPIVNCLLLRLASKASAPRAAAACTAVLRRFEAKLAQPLAQALVQYIALSVV